MGLPAIIVAVAVVTPLLSQTVSAPMYAALDGVDYDDRPPVSAAVLRALPKGVALAVAVAGRGRTRGVPRLGAHRGAGDQRLARCSTS